MSVANPFGVLDFLAWDHDWNARHYPPDDIEKSAQLMKKAGIGCVRMDFLWSDIEPASGQFIFAKYEAIVDCLSRYSIDILGLLHYNPAWRPVPWNQAPIPADFARYAKAVVRHFQKSVHYWEIWNEPDHAVYWEPQDNLQAYSRLLKSVYPLIKETDPDCRILMGGLTNVPSPNLEQLYVQAGRESFDIVNIHPFVSPLVGNAADVLRGKVDHTRMVMQKYGDAAKPIWITEIGCPGTPERLTWWLGESPNEIEQAGWVQTLYNQGLQWMNVEKIFWAFFRDTQGHFKDAVDHFGLVRHDFTPKPAYAAYQEAARQFFARP